MPRGGARAGAGRPPKPVEQKRRTGNPGHRPLPNGGQLAAVAPVERTDLDLTAEEVFELVLRRGVEWIGATDAVKVRILREQLEERESLRAAVLDGVGDRKQLRELEREIASALSVLGFDPAARTRLGLAEVKRETKLEALRAGQAKRLAPPVADKNDAG